MRILIVTQYFWPENFKINDFAIGMAERGHNVTVLTGKPNYPGGKFFDGYNYLNRRRENYKGVNLIRVPLIARGRGTGARLVVNYISFALFGSIAAYFRLKEKYDIIFVFEVSPITVGIPAIIIKQKQKIPLFFWVLDLWPETVQFVGDVQNSLAIKLLNKLVRYIYKSSDKIFISSRAFSDSVCDKGVDSAKIVYYPNWSEDFYLNANPDKTRYSHLIPNGFILIFAGNIGDSQDFESILKAADMLRDFQSIHWIIIGDGRKKPWLSDEVKRLKLEKNFHLIGSYRQDEMPNFFVHCDAMIVALKKSELFSLTVPAKIQTYMAFGKPIIAMIDGEGASIIKEAGAGLTCDAGDYTQLAENIKKMYLLDGQRINDMGENGRKYCIKHFNRDLLFMKFEKEFYDFSNQGTIKN